MTAKPVAFTLVTAPVVVAFLGSGLANLLHAESIVHDMAHLGYPGYVSGILGVWKILGGLTVASLRRFRGSRSGRTRGWSSISRVRRFRAESWETALAESSRRSPSQRWWWRRGGSARQGAFWQAPTRAQDCPMARRPGLPARSRGHDPLAACNKTRHGVERRGLTAIEGRQRLGADLSVWRRAFFTSSMAKTVPGRTGPERRRVMRPRHHPDPLLGGGARRGSQVLIH